ncbi:hypothetical protein F5882DRAFT_464018 [Hyaloscypha sp. PMI_1271]|nr:hypothetical protein F5882DRAFT_464018 [Hyaloscypha sp. PMI_1271]
MRSRDLNPYVMEHASKPTFWVLGLSIIAFWFATVLSAPKSASNSDHKLFSHHFTKVLTPSFTSRFRKIFTIAIYILILYLQILKGKWGLQANRRLMGKFLGNCPRREAGRRGLSAVIPVLWMFTVLVGISIVGLQVYV